ncbi:MAG: hypothetical protein ABSG86_17980 [Thermoguttaceae bacterium]|jgi:hypothetical protein
MKNFILGYLQEHGDVTPDNLAVAAQAAGFEAKGWCELTDGKHVFVECVSPSFADVLQRLIQSNEVAVKPINIIEFLFENGYVSNNKALLPIYLRLPTR